MLFYIDQRQMSGSDKSSSSRVYGSDVDVKVPFRKKTRF